MPKLDDTELALLKAVAELGVAKGDLLSLARKAKLSVARTIDVRNYLMREGYLMEIDRRYRITDEGIDALKHEIKSPGKTAGQD